ncbi:hypothetical protein AAG570_011335 [Ranatra chinensis]|uniref:1-acyl-sn-glycerol-3-phosphate acyltransferase n=1 Tax=Ranatra chinensis TaxID=642074 RepID=A0ABD0YYL7_9HEMI
MIRYYGCYIFYCVYFSTVGPILVPVFLLRPKNVINLRIAGTVLKHTTKLIGIRWVLRNKHIIEEERGAIIVANHQSVFDVLGMLNIWNVMGKCTAIAKKELLYIPPFGPVAWLAGLVYIDRVNGKSAYKQIIEASRLTRYEKTKLWFFPEGTRNRKGGGILPFKKGAFRVAIECQAPIIPVVFSPYYFINSKEKSFSRGEVIISTLEPVPTVGLTLNDLDPLMEQIHKLMSAKYSELQEEVSKFEDDSIYEKSM